MMQEAEIGLIGLAVMGQNLALNIDEKGFSIAVFNRTVSKVDAFMQQAGKDSHIIATHSLTTLIETLKPPRKLILMVKAGDAVDHLLEQLIPLLNENDIVMDGGNSLYTDTNRRTQWLAEKGIKYLGIGISGGEEGARHGPAIMPGGNKQAWLAVQAVLQTIAAQVEGKACCDWVGEGGAGHYVKMVHNGIEYGDMQLICEAYDFLRHGMQKEVSEIQALFSQWNTGVLDSYLMEISADILAVKDHDGTPLVDNILDSAGQKGTGKWTAIDAMEQGIPLTLISEAVCSRFISSLKAQRIHAQKVLPVVVERFNKDQSEYIQYLEDALYAAKIISYAQGYMLMQQASNSYQWQLNYAGIAQMWRGGCIIRSRFLDDIYQAYTDNPKLEHLLLAPFFVQAIEKAQKGWRKVVAMAAEIGIPVPALGSALSFYDSYRQLQLPANLLQAQRDYFGAHQYERIDKPRGEFFHTNWMEKGV